ncbi:MAG: methyltransferase domain-containing protein [Candidatus Lokiarchaeota archaeon]|nr:methyltransferase domain-containing protein [Candidatus Lokiarchaeota archaeon]MBD3199128.1 methyltransferase domain-containing protein [Candidatus Lokiarchaeota archaeon]
MYNPFAHDYHQKRRRIWNDLKIFFKDLEKEGYGFQGINIDLGCANGRHFPLFKNKTNKLIGVDNSLDFINIAKEYINELPNLTENNHQNISLIQADMQYLPFRENSINNIFSIASLHHIRNSHERKKIVKQISVILKANGKFLLTLWARWQKRFRKHFIKDWILRKLTLNKMKSKDELKSKLSEFGDILIPWTISAQKKTIQRFYHLSSKREILNLLKNYKIDLIKKMGGPGGKDNFFILAANR